MRVLVLSGGGSKGAFQLGVLDRLLANCATSYDAIFGVSTGALTASVLAQGDTALGQRQQLNKLLDLYDQITSNADIIRSGSWFGSVVWNLLTRGGIYDPTPLHNLVDKYVDPDALAHSLTHLEVGYTDLETGQFYTATGDEPKIRDFVRASAYQPVFFQLPSVLADGGVRNQTPLAAAFRYIKQCRTANSPSGIVNIDVVLCNPIGEMQFKSVNPRSVKEVLGRTFDIIENEVYMNDLKRALKKNDKPDADDLRANISVYAPDVDLGDGLTFDHKAITRMMRLGSMTYNQIRKLEP